MIRKILFFFLILLISISFLFCPTNGNVFAAGSVSSSGTTTPPYKYKTNEVNTWENVLLGGWAWPRADYQTGFLSASAFSTSGVLLPVGGASAQATQFIDIEIPGGQLSEVTVVANLIYTGGVQKFGLSAAAWGGIDKVYFIGNDYHKVKLDPAFGYDDIGWAILDLGATLIPGVALASGFNKTSKVILMVETLSQIKSSLDLAMAFDALVEAGKAKKTSITFSFTTDQTTQVGVGMRVDTSGSSLGACDATVYGFLENIYVNIEPISAETYLGCNYWDGDNTNGIIDESGNLNSAWAKNGVTRTSPGRAGNGIRLDGVDDWVQIEFDNNELDALSRQGTIAMWVKPEQLADAVLLFGGKGSYANALYQNKVKQLHLGTSFDGKFIFNINGTEPQQIYYFEKFGSYTPGEWTHVAAVYNYWGSDVSGDTWTFYVNGHPVEPYASLRTPQIAPAHMEFDDFRLGRPNFPHRFYKGEMDEIKIYSRALSAEEVLASCWAGIDITPPSVPVMVLEPQYTAGDQNMVACNPATDSESGVWQYYFENLMGGSPIDNSGWTSSRSHIFNDLEDGVTYSYRVKAKDYLGNTSTWSSLVSSTQDQSGPLVSDFPSDYTIKGNIGFGGIDFELPLQASDSWGISKVLIEEPINYQYTFDQPYPTSISSFGMSLPPTYAAVFTRADRAGRISGSVVDAAGNVTPFTTDSIRIDYHAPVGSIVINQNDWFTTEQDVTLELYYRDIDGPFGNNVGLDVTDARYRNTGEAWSEWEPVNVEKEWRLTDIFGIKTVEVQFRDGYNHLSQIYSKSIHYREALAGEIVINDGNPWANEQEVDLQLEATGSAEQMAIWNDDPDYIPNEGDWQPFSSNSSWDLSPGEGLKTVYVCFKGGGQISPNYSDSIRLDTVPPYVYLTINGGENSTASSSVTLNIEPGDPGANVAQMRFSNDYQNWSPWEAFAESRSWQLIPGHGYRVVYIEVQDEAGNFNQFQENSSIFVDHCPPHGLLEIDDQNPYSGDTTVTVKATLGGQLYSLPEQFSSLQGDLNWNYYRMDEDGAVYELVWDNVLGDLSQKYYSWNTNQGEEDEFVDLQVTGPEQGAYLQPGSEAGIIALAWSNRDKAATVSIRGELWLSPEVISDTTLEGEVKFAIWINDEIQVAESLINGDNPTVILELNNLELEENDVVYFVAGPNYISGNDKLFYHFQVIDHFESEPAYVRFANLLPEMLEESRYESEIFWWTGLKGVEWSDWEELDPVFQDAAWEIPGGEGYKTVMAQFRDGVGNVSHPYRAGITLDLTPPTGTFRINYGEIETDDPSLWLNLQATDLLSGVAGMKITENGSTGQWENYRCEKYWHLDLPDDGQEGEYILEVAFRDTTGNVSSPAAAKILFNPLFKGVSSGNAYISVQLADLNGDGLVDLVYLKERGKLGIAINEGSGDFIENPAAFSEPVGGVARVLIGDLDNNGYLDLVTIPDYIKSDRLEIFFNNGDGTFYTDEKAVPNHGYDQIVEGAVAELNNDGQLDLVLSGMIDLGSENYNYSTKVFFNSNGRYDQVLICELEDLLALSIAAGDLTGNGFQELILGKVHSPVGGMDGAQVIEIFEFDGMDFDLLTKLIPSEVNTNGLFPMAVYDFDGDGDLDILSGGSHTIAWINNNTTFTPDTETDFYSKPAKQIIPVDINSDSVLDLVLSCTTGVDQYTSIFGLSWGEPAAGREYSIAYQIDNSNLTIGDMNGNNLADLMIGFLTGPMTEYYYGTPNDLKLFCRAGANQPPGQPERLIPIVSGDEVTLSWLAAEDDKTPSSMLTYNLRIGTTENGNEIFSGITAPGFGNMGCFLEKTITLDNGVYFWGVQTVDGSYALSEWSSGWFAVKPPGYGLLTVGSSNPGTGVVISSTTGHGGTTVYHHIVEHGTLINLEAPLYYGSGADRKRFDYWWSYAEGNFSSQRSITFSLPTASGYDDIDLSAVYVADPDQPSILSTKIGVHRDNTFYLDADGDLNFDAAIDRFSNFGTPDDIPVIGDWNGDGYDQIGIRRDNTFYLDYNDNMAWEYPGDIFGNFGVATDTVLIGDWNGDGKDQVGVWREGTFYLDYDGNLDFDSSVDKMYSFGASDGIPITGDWNGDGHDQIGVRSGSTFYLDYDGDGAWDAALDRMGSFGLAADKILIGDWSGTGHDRVGVHRDNTFYLDYDGDLNFDSSIDLYSNFGTPDDIPVIGDWNGDGIDQIGIRRGPTFYLDYNDNMAWEYPGDIFGNFGISTDEILLGKWGSGLE